MLPITTCYDNTAITKQIIKFQPIILTIFFACFPEIPTAIISSSIFTTLCFIMNTIKHLWYFLTTPVNLTCLCGLVGTE